MLRAPLLEAIVVIAPREQGRQDLEELRAHLNTLMHYVLQFTFDFSNVLLCELERGAMSCIKQTTSGGGIIPSCQVGMECASSYTTGPLYINTTRQKTLSREY